MWPETVRKEDLRFDFIRGSGAGGQNRNKVCTAVRITHLPTGISSYSEEERTQSRNKSIAWRRISRTLAGIMRSSVVGERLRRTANDAHVRTYNQRTGVRDASTGRHYSYTACLFGSDFEKIVRDRLATDISA